MTEDLTAKKSQAYDIIKAAAIILVVLAHVLRMYVGDGVFTPANPSRFLRSLSLYIYSFHMPLFVAVSGCVYGYCVEGGKYENKGKFVTGKLRRIILPYLIFGLLWVTPTMKLCSLTDMGFFEYFFRGIVLSLNPRHLWYLLALFWIYILAIPLRPMIKSGKPWYLLISLLLFGAYLKLPGYNHLQLIPALRYQLYFFLGVAINHYFPVLLRAIRRLYIPIYILCPLLLVVSLKFDPSWLTKLGYAIIGIIWFVAIGGGLADKCGDKIAGIKWYRVLNRDSFGLYLFHPMIIYVIFWQLGGLNINPWLLSAGAFIVSAGLSIVLTELLRKCRAGIAIGE